VGGGGVLSREEVVEDTQGNGQRESIGEKRAVRMPH
jgi:hypothetical protein